MNLDLSGKTALVGGSSRGIGKATAIELANLGANVILMSRSEDILKNVVEELDSSKGQQHGYIVADHSNPNGLQDAVQDYMAANGITVNILVKNSGGPPAGPITEADSEEFLNAFGNHLICNHLMAQAVFPGMRDSGYGRIINVISTSVKQPLANLGVSNTTRGAVANWAKTWANEVGQYGITVNNVLPGATATDRLTSIIQNKAKKTGKAESEVSESMKSAIPLRRFAMPEEVAQAVAFLASPAAGYISGTNVPVDGGRLGVL